MRSHSVTCHPAEVTFPPLPQSKLVLDLATPEGCKAELTWVVVISQDSLPAKYGQLSGEYIASPAYLGAASLTTFGAFWAEKSASGERNFSTIN